MLVGIPPATWGVGRISLRRVKKTEHAPLVMVTQLASCSEQLGADDTR